MPSEPRPLEAFSLLGGPLQSLGCKLGLVRSNGNNVAMGIALGGSVWLLLMALALIEQLTPQVLSLSVVGGHVRLLLVIPLLFLCETFFDLHAGRFVRTIVESQVVPQTELPEFYAEISRITRLQRSWMPDAACLLLAVMMTLLVPTLVLPGTTTSFHPGHGTGAASLTAGWYWTICLPLFRFLMLRWAWRLALWCYFLWRVARLKLYLVPSHPDRAAGLGYLEVVHGGFAPLVFAISASVAATFAEGILAGTVVFTTIYQVLALLVLVNAVLFLGPLAIFSPSLSRCRLKGMEDYMGLATRYVMDFDNKWVRASVRPGEPLLGTQDIQALSDLGNAMRVVEDTNPFPAGHRLLVILAVATLLPMLPLVLFRYPIGEIAEKLLKVVFTL